MWKRDKFLSPDQFNVDGGVLQWQAVWKKVFSYQF